MSQVCDCYGLSRKKIKDAIKNNQLDSADAVYEFFDAAACGVCTGDMEKLVEETLAEAG